jgi:Replication factor RFC1 C terminal domain
MAIVVCRACVLTQAPRSGCVRLVRPHLLPTWQDGQPLDGNATLLSGQQLSAVRCRDDFDAILDITKFKTSAGWGADPMRSVETKVKSAFTRSFNKVGLHAKTSIMVEDGKRTARGQRPSAPDDDTEMEGELAEVRCEYLCSPPFPRRRCSVEDRSLVALRCIAPCALPLQARRAARPAADSNADNKHHRKSTHNERHRRPCCVKVRQCYVRRFN